jgi:transglutaminase-like putative cysteine protease
MTSNHASRFRGDVGRRSIPRNRRLIIVQLSVLSALTFALGLMSVNARAGDDAPAWLRAAAGSTIPSFPRDVPAVILADESVVTIEDDGRMTRSDFYAVKVLTREGREEAVAHAVYNTDSEKVKELRAWLISPSGKVKKYGKGETAELALVDNDVYNEAKQLIIAATGDAELGSIFGYETVTEDRSVFSQLTWYFQGAPLPVLKSRISVTLPRGWTADALTLNHEKIEPTMSGNSYAWELRDLPPVTHEPLSPPRTAITPWLAINLTPSADKPSTRRSFANWVDVSRWLSEISDSQAALGDALAGKANQITAASRSEMEKIAAVGRFVQAVNYVSIQIGTGRGGGYRPHAATEVFAKSYGDCKDKANLMRAMLKAVGIKSYLVCIYSGDPNHVRQEWPSPHQFNHCIIAVKAGDETQALTVINHPTLGRLLIFDPTDDITPVGDLPTHEQGSFALIIAGESGALLRMPVTPPEANMLTRSAEVQLNPDGSIVATMREQSIGQAAVKERGPFRGLTRPEYNERIERWIAQGATGVRVSKIEPLDEPNEGRFSLGADFSAPAYGQLMQGRLLVFRPAIVSRRESLSLTEPARKHPVVLTPQAYTEATKVRLPAGFEVDELPDAVKLDMPFGSYVTSYIVKDGQLLFTRKLVVRASTIPVADYAKVRGFFERIRAAEQSPVVLVKK